MGVKPSNGANGLDVHSQPFPTSSCTPHALAPPGFDPAGTGSSRSPPKLPCSGAGAASPQGNARSGPAGVPKAARWYSASVGSLRPFHRAYAEASAWLTHTGHAGGSGTNPNCPVQSHPRPSRRQNVGCEIPWRASHSTSPGAQRDASEYPPASTNPRKSAFVTGIASIVKEGTEAQALGNSLSQPNGISPRAAPSVATPAGIRTPSPRGTAPSVSGLGAAAGARFS